MEPAGVFLVVLTSGVNTHHMNFYLSPVSLLIQNPVQGAIPTNLPNTAVGLRPPYSPSLPAPSPQLPPAFFSSSISDMPPLESYSSLGQRDQGSTQAQDALGGFPTDGEGKAGVAAGGLDSLSEYTLPGELKG